MTSVEGRTVIIVDDGIATGGTARAAVQIARSRGARRVILAVPVAPPESVHELSDVADAVVAVSTPSPFYAIGAWYEQFTQTTDDEVRTLLHAAATPGSVDDDPVDDDQVGEDLPFDDEVLVASESLGRPGSSHGPAGCARPGALRAREREQPAQSPQPVRGRAHARSRARDPAVRPLVTRRSARAWQRLRRRAVGGAVARGNAMGSTATLVRRSADRLFRGQYRSGRGIVGRRAKTRPSPRSCPVEAVPILPPYVSHAVEVTDLVHRRGRRHRRAPAQRRGGRAAFAVSTESRSCPVRRICSRNPAHSKQPPMPLRTGSFGTSPASPLHAERRSRPTTTTRST